VNAQPKSPAAAAVGFATTRWSVILSSSGGDPDEEEAQRALAEVCRIYWRPVFAFICAEGHSPEDAQDYTQEFFHMVLATGWLRKADRSRGRFRSLLLRSLRNFVRDQVQKGRAQRRGGGCEFVSWDDWTADAPSQVAFSAKQLGVLPAEQLFDVRWAITVAEQALRRLAAECEQRGRRRLFETLSHYLTADGEVSYANLARQLGLAETELKRQLHTMRSRYRWLLRSEVARTIQDPLEIEDEIRNLCAALAAGAH